MLPQDEEVWQEPHEFAAACQVFQVGELMAYLGR